MGKRHPPDYATDWITSIWSDFLCSVLIYSDLLHSFHHINTTWSILICFDLLHSLYHIHTIWSILICSDLLRSLIHIHLISLYNLNSDRPRVSTFRIWAQWTPSIPKELHGPNNGILRVENFIIGVLYPKSNPVLLLYR